METPLPCPFCASEPELNFVGPELSEPELEPYHYVQCMAEGHCVETYGSTAEEAVTKWNHRP